jgi:dGTPase
MRHPAARDRDRVLYTSALRRLAGVTQVIGAGESAVFHNRLTHTHEVAQIAKRLAERLLDIERGEGRGDLIRQLGGLDPSTAEAAALAHDLGHPPFGHIGEQELDRAMRGRQVPDGFEGNAQTFRIITKLAVRYKDQPGLNLTRATLNAVSKYPWMRHPQGERYRKFGVYSSEDRDFRWARERLPGPTDRKNLEAEIMDWADDIAYAVGDLEDFFRAGLIPLDRLATDQNALDKFISSVFERRRKKGIPLSNQEELGRAVTPVLRSFPITEPYLPIRRHRAELRRFTSYLISRYLDAFRLREPTSDAPSPASIDPDALLEVTMLKELTWEYVIDNVRLASQQYGQRKVVRELFDIFAELSVEPKRWYMLPVGLRESLDECSQSGEESDPERLRAVCDFVASMADQEAVRMYQRLTGIVLGSALEAVVF